MTRHLTETFRVGRFWFWRCHRCATFDGAFKTESAADRAAMRHVAKRFAGVSK